MSLKMKPRKSLVNRLRAGAERERNHNWGPRSASLVSTNHSSRVPKVRVRRRAVGHLGTHDPQFRGRQIIEVEGRRDFHAPIDGPESGVAMEQIEGQQKGLRVQELIGVPKEILLALIDGAFKGCRAGRNLVLLKQGDGRRGDFQKDILAQDRIVPLQDILVVGVPPVPGHVGIVVHRGMSLAIAIPFGKADAPAIFHRHKMIVLLPLARQHAGAAGKTDRRIDGRLVKRRLLLHRRRRLQDRCGRFARGREQFRLPPHLARGRDLLRLLNRLGLGPAYRLDQRRTVRAGCRVLGQGGELGTTAQGPTPQQHQAPKLATRLDFASHS